MSLAIFGMTVLIGLVAFSTSILWYSPLLFGEVWKQGANASLEASASWKFMVMPFREILTALTLLFLLTRMPREDTGEAILLAVVLWAGFYGVQLAGAVLWDGRPPALGAVHAGDWLVKLVIITVGLNLALRWQQVV